MVCESSDVRKFLKKSKFQNFSELFKGAFTYDVSSRGGGGFEMLTVADKGGGALSLADVSKNT